jgi:hypothetical protein
MIWATLLVGLDGHFLKAPLIFGVLRCRAVELAGDVDAEQAFFFAVVLPFLAETRKVGGLRLDGADDGGKLHLFEQVFQAVAFARYGDGQIAKLEGPEDDFAAGVGAEFGYLPPFGTCIDGRLPVENAGLAALGIYHIEQKGGDFGLAELAFGPYCRIVGIPALVVFLPEIAIFAMAHILVVVVEERDHGRTPSRRPKRQRHPRRT